MAGTSVSSSQSTSTSTPIIPNYPQSPFLQAIAAYAGQVGSQVYNWAQQQYAKNSSLTDANVNNFLNTSANALGQAQRDTSRYQNLFQPEENQLLADANSYSSPNRVKMEMGAAESDQAQAAEANRQNAERDLQSYGIDPSSGRYAALDKAAAVQAAANEAGAAQRARYNTEATGRALRSEAIQVGERYPGQISNDLNTTLQGFAGAENAGLANSAAGVALQGAADPYLNTASSLKYPPLGQQTNSQSTSQGTSNSTDPAQNQNQKNQPSQQGAGAPPNVSAGGGGWGGSDSGAGGSNQTDVPGGDSSGGGGDVWSNGSGTDYSGLGSTDWTGGGGLADYTGSWGGATMPSGDYGNSYAPSDGSVFDTGSGVDYSGAGDFSFAEGGDIDDGDDDTGAIPTDGGAIPSSASPSGGQRVDDVRAQSPRGPINVNAHEFVIPQDVALWKGQEFFQKLIQNSRMSRMTAPARPQQRPQPGMR